MITGTGGEILGRTVVVNGKILVVYENRDWRVILGHTGGGGSKILQMYENRDCRGDIGTYGAGSG